MKAKNDHPFKILSPLCRHSGASSLHTTRSYLVLAVSHFTTLYLNWFIGNTSTTPLFQIANALGDDMTYIPDDSNLPSIDKT